MHLPNSYRPLSAETLISLILYVYTNTQVHVMYTAYMAATSAI